MKSNWLVFALLFVGALLLLEPVWAAGPREMDLLEARAKGIVTVEVRSASTYKKMTLVITNKIAEILVLDISQAGFIPRKGEAQRIGISHLEGKPGEYKVQVPASGRAELVFAARCLDRSRPAPATGTVFELMRNPLPEFIVGMLRKGESQGVMWKTIEAKNAGKPWGKYMQTGSLTDLPQLPLNPAIAQAKLKPGFGAVALQYDGRTRVYWNILQADAFGDYKRVAHSANINKGGVSVVALKPGKYRAKMSLNNGFKPVDFTVQAGKIVVVRPVLGAIAFAWHGKSRVFWRIFAPDSQGDFHNVGSSGYISKGARNVVEMAPGEYRVSMQWNNGFKARDVVVTKGRIVSVEVIFGAVEFTWDGVNKVYWNILQKDAYGDYLKVGNTAYVSKGAASLVELAPGDYRMKMGSYIGYVPVDVVVKPSELVSIRPKYAAIEFTWAPKEKTYWRIYRKDAHGDYQSMMSTSYLSKSETQRIELAPGVYYVRRQLKDAPYSEVALKAGQKAVVGK